jgi:hypothetical protein
MVQVRYSMCFRAAGVAAYLTNRGTDKVGESQWAPPDDEIDIVDRII